MRQPLRSLRGMGAGSVQPRPRSKKGAVKVAVDEESAELEEAKIATASKGVKTYFGASNINPSQHEREEGEDEEGASQSGNQVNASGASTRQGRTMGFEVSRIATSIPMAVAGMD